LSDKESYPNFLGVVFCCSGGNGRLASSPGIWLK